MPWLAQLRWPAAPMCRAAAVEVGRSWRGEHAHTFFSQTGLTARGRRCTCPTSHIWRGILCGAIRSMVQRMQSFGQLAARDPALMAEFSDSRSLLLGLNSVIHPEVRKVYPGADVPVFEVVSGDPNSLSLSYASKRGLCFFAEGLALGVGDHFGETFVVTQPVCQHKGGDHCELEFTWPTEGP